MGAISAMFGESAQASPAVRRARAGGRSASSNLPVNQKGWPKSKTYSVEELVLWWRTLWTRHFPRVDAPRWPWYLRKHLLAWLKSDGHEMVEGVFEFVFDNWKRLQHSIESLQEAVGPTLSVMYSYRDRFRSEFTRSKSTTKKWTAAQWKGDDNATGIDEELLASI